MKRLSKNLLVALLVIFACIGIAVTAVVIYYYPVIDRTIVRPCYYYPKAFSDC